MTTTNKAMKREAILYEQEMFPHLAFRASSLGLSGIAARAGARMQPVFAERQSE